MRSVPTAGDARESRIRRPIRTASEIPIRLYGGLPSFDHRAGPLVAIVQFRGHHSECLVDPERNRCRLALAPGPNSERWFTAAEVLRLARVASFGLVVISDIGSGAPEIPRSSRAPGARDPGYARHVLPADLCSCPGCRKPVLIRRPRDGGPAELVEPSAAVARRISALLQAAGIDPPRLRSRPIRAGAAHRCYTLRLSPNPPEAPARYLVESDKRHPLYLLIGGSIEDARSYVFSGHPADFGGSVRAIGDEEAAALPSWVYSRRLVGQVVGQVVGEIPAATRLSPVELAELVERENAFYAELDREAPSKPARRKPRASAAVAPEAAGPVRWQVYRATDSGRLWAGKARIRKAGDPKPRPATTRAKRAHYLGEGCAISWETSRRKAVFFASRGEAERYAIAQGWPPIDLRAIRSTEAPSIDDEAPASASPKGPRRPAKPSPEIPAGSPGPAAEAAPRRKPRASGPASSSRASASSSRASASSTGPASSSRASAEKPYAWDIVVRRYDGSTEAIVRVAKSEREARKLGMLRSRAEAVDSVEPMTREQYHRAYGARPRRALR